VFVNDFVMFTPVGQPYFADNINPTDGCTSFTASWTINSDSVCAPFMQDVAVSPFNGGIMQLNDSFYNITNLPPNDNYTITVTGSNDAGMVKESFSNIRVAGNVNILNLCVYNFNKLFYYN